MSGGEQQMLAIARAADVPAPAPAAGRAVAGSRPAGHPGAVPTARSSSTRRRARRCWSSSRTPTWRSSIAERGYVLEAGEIVVSGTADRAAGRRVRAQGVPGVLRDRGALLPAGRQRHPERRHLRLPGPRPRPHLPVDRRCSTSPRARWRCSRPSSPGCCRTTACRSCSPSSGRWPCRSSVAPSSSGRSSARSGTDNVLAIVIVTIGIFIAVNALAGWIYGTDGRTFPRIFSNESLVDIGGVTITNETVGTVGILLAVVVLLYLLFQKTKVGLAMRAVASNQESSGLVGIRIGHILMLGWGLAAALGALAGALAAPQLNLEPEPHAERAGLLLRCRHARRVRQPDRGGRRRAHRRCDPEPGRPVHRLLRRVRAGVGLPAHPHRAARPAPGAVRPQGGRPRYESLHADPAPDRPRHRHRRPGRLRALHPAVLPGVPDRAVHLGHRHLDRRPRPRPAHRLQRPDLGRPRRLLRHRGLHDGDPHGRPRVEPPVRRSPWPC